MKIIISPAKQMKTANDFMKAESLPPLLDKTEQLLARMQEFDRADLKELFRANDRITEENYLRYQSMDLRNGLSPAVLTYRGLAFSNMAPQIFTKEQWKYVQKHLKILSGFYGILNAADGVVPYRLEMQTKLEINGKQDLYEFWGEDLYRVLAEEIREERKQKTSSEDTAVILNLASKEYSRAVEPYVEKDISFVTCIFGEESEGTVKIKGTFAKMARGQMCAWLAANQIDTLEGVKSFQESGYRYAEAYSSSKELVFLKA